MNKIKGCKIYGHVCQYKCCNHGTGSSYYIWMYPGEYENSLKRKNHIEIIGKNNGATLGRCKCKDYEKERCDGKEWFKPLDCWSYPFFPFIEEGRLILKVDSSRCPMVEKEDLEEQYVQVYKIWEELICNEKIYHCIDSMTMNGYSIYTPKRIIEGHGSKK